MKRFGLMVAFAASGLAATAWAKDTRVFVLSDAAVKSIHRFNVTDVGGPNETWTETTPLCTFSGTKTVKNVIPAHGYYYVCYTSGEVWRFSKAGVELGKVGTLGCGECFEISADQSYIYSADMTLETGKNCIGQLHLGYPAYSVVVTNDIAQVRSLAWGADGLLYASSRSSGTGTDYWGKAISVGMYRGVQAFDVSNGKGAVLKHYYKAANSSGGCGVDAAHGHVYSFSAGTSSCYVWGLAEDAPDGEWNQYARATPTVSLGNPFSGGFVAGLVYTGDWKNDGLAANIYRFNADNTATLVTSILDVTGGTSEKLNKMRAIREDVFPEEDATLAITKLGDYWSFNHAGETSTDISQIFSSKVSPLRTAVLNSGFTAGVRGVVREGLWCAEGANGRLASALLVGQTNDFTVTCFLGFPSALSGPQTLFSNPKVTISVTADGFLKADIPDGAAIGGAAATGASVTGTSNLADGQWHQIAVMRRANRLEVWVDAVREGESAETTVAAYDDLSTQWSFLAATNANRMFIDELRFYTGPALTTGDLKLLRRIATNADLTVPRDPAARSDAAALAVGTIVAHADAADHAWGVPMVVADTDGTTLYAAADFGRAKGKNNQSVIWKSTDRGETWARVRGEPSFSCLSLFKFAADAQGTLRVAGLDSDSYLAWGFTSADGGASLVSPYIQSTTALPAPWYPVPCASGFARNVALPSGIYNLDVCASGKGFLVPYSTAVSNLYNVSGLRLGGAFSDSNNTAVAFCHQTVGRHANATNAAPCEVLGVLRREGERSLPYRGAATFPGASRPFGALWDATSHRYWAVVTYAQDDSQTPWLRANRLALYSATDLVGWQKCCDLAVAGTPATAGFNTPNLTVAGDDLVVVFGASLSDETGTAAARDVNVSNYILSKRIANFRSLAPAPDPTRTRTLLVSDSSASRILRLEEDPTTGTWLNAGYFAPGSYAVSASESAAVGSGDDFVSRGEKVWILSAGRIFEFGTDGTYAGTCFDLTSDSDVVPYNPDVLGLSYDGRFIYSMYGFVDKTGNTRYIYRTDLSTGTTVQFCKSTDENLDTRLWRARALTGLPDGSVAVAARDANLVFRLSASGAFVEDIWTGIPGPQTMFFDRRAKRLYISGFSTNLYCWNYATDEKTSKKGLANIVGITGDSRGRVFGSAFNAPAGLSDLLADGGRFTTVGHREILLGGQNFFRCCFFDTAPLPGMLIFVR